ncbi:MAG: aminotransferase class IV [Prochloraceae cyanobacterium]|nr:aminotransferase class IV [Prochloraceae cyanobacterium]
MDIHDPGLLYGATVFTTLRVYSQSLDFPLTNWMAHCDRLRGSIEAMRWQLPDWKRLRKGARSLLPYYPVLRITIFADGRELIIGRSLPKNLQQLQQFGAIAKVADNPMFRRQLSTHKTGNYLPAWLALQEVQKLGAREAILVDSNGNWLETSTGNLWGWKDDRWYTPNGDLLPGIARSQLLNWLHSQNLSVGRDAWNWNFVKNLEAIAYSNSVVEVIPLSRIISTQGNLTPDPCHPALEYLRSCFRLSSSA